MHYLSLLENMHAFQGNLLQNLGYFKTICTFKINMFIRHKKIYFFDVKIGNPEMHFI